jgi:hypothetical protein
MAHAGTVDGQPSQLPQGGAGQNFGPPSSQPGLKGYELPELNQIFKHMQTQVGPIDTRTTMAPQNPEIGFQPDVDDLTHVYPENPGLGNRVQRLIRTGDIEGFSDGEGSKYIHELIAEFMRRRTGV